MSNQEIAFDPTWSIILKSLYYDLQGDWSKAHDIVDGANGLDAAHVHAYLHRKEGDQWNADYWYKRAQQPIYSGSLQAEWESLWELYNQDH